MSKDIINSVKGFRDILPDSIQYYRLIEETLELITHQHGISEIRLPVLEKSDLFNRSIGTETEIVNKEMYTFLDKNNDSLSMRPEGTASCVRCALEHKLIYDRGIKKQKFWYYGPMFRYERPQKGRFRQFNQFGIEIFGYTNIDNDIEVIQIADRIWKHLSLNDVDFHINSLGQKDDKKKYANIISDHVKKYENDLDETSLATYKRNPLRLLDSKNQMVKKILSDVPLITETLGVESKKRFENLLLSLDDLNFSYQVDNSIVRGLDYYNDTVFEWKHKSLGSQDAVCAGGRYDSLVGQIGNVDVPAIGFALGVERIIEILKEADIKNSDESLCISIIDVTTKKNASISLLSQLLRDKFLNISFHNMDSSSSLSAQLKHASKLEASYVIILGDDEAAENRYLLKKFDSKEELQLSKDELFNFIAKIK